MAGREKVYGLIPDSAGGHATAKIIAEGLHHPNGIAANWTACTVETAATACGGAGVGCDTTYGFCDDASLYVAEVSLSY